MGPLVAASLEVFAHASAPRGKPEFGIDDVKVGRKDVRGRRGDPAPQAVRATQAFRSRRRRQSGPRLLIVAPMSGHYATLLRGTVERLLPSHDVYITDWRDAKLVPLSDGSFDLDDYVDYLIEFLEMIGETTGRAAAHARGLPAGGAGLCGDGADERGQEHVAAARR